MQQQLSPATSGSAPTGQHHHRLYSETLNSPYYPPSQNPSFNSNYSPVQLPNLDPNSALHMNQYANAYVNASTGVSTLIQPSIIDPNPALNINHYANAPIGVSKLVQPNNLDPNSGLNTNHYANSASNQGNHQQPGLAHIYLQSGAVPQEPNAIRQQYTLNSVKTNQNVAPQKRILRKNNRPKKVKVVQLFQCEVCKVDCNSESVLDLHNKGSKHKKTLVKLGLAEPNVTPVWCEVCKVQVNSNVVLEQHKLGKNHKKNLDKLSAANSDVPLTFCDVCQVNYSSKIVLDQHKLGKKHKKQVQKLTQVKSIALAGPTPTPAPTPTPTPILDPVSGVSSTSPVTELGENPGEITTATVDQKAQGGKKGGSDDLESKKNKVIQCGATPESVCTCPVCNVVCNSMEVFKFHLAGKKHTALMKKRESAAPATANITAVTAL